MSLSFEKQLALAFANATLREEVLPQKLYEQLTGRPMPDFAVDPLGNQRWVHEAMGRQAQMFVDAFTSGLRKQEDAAWKDLA